MAEAVVNCVDRIFNDGWYADKVIEQTLKNNRKWGSRDRGFVAEYTYEMVRWWRLLQYAVGCEDRTDKGALWLCFAALHLKKGYDLPFWNEFKNLQPDKIYNRLKDERLERKIRESIPDWMDEIGEKELGTAWDAEIKALNKTAPLVLRANKIKIGAKELQRVLQNEEVMAELVPNIPDALLVKKRSNLFTLKAFKDGLFEVQDGSSQLIAPLLKVEPGMRVIDACAGAGGKTLHLAAMMQNKGRIISMDTSSRKLEELMRRAKRAGINNVETKEIDSTKVIKRLEGSADRLLLDVPCSGMGVLRRNPDAKWKLKPQFIEEIKATQQEIISSYSTMLKPGGLMVYATCSILPSEDEQQVETFLNSHKTFVLLEQHRISATQGFDGFFMALLQKQ